MNLPLQMAHAPDGEPADAPRLAARDLRVAFVSDAIPGRNGVGTYYADLLDHLAGRVAHAVVFGPTPDRTGPHEGWSVPLPGDPTQRFCVPRFRALLAALEQLDPHMVVLPTPGPYGIAGRWYARRKGLPVCVGYQTDYEQLVRLYWPWTFGAPIGRLLRAVQRWFFRRGDVVVTISDGMAADAQSGGAKDVRLIGTPIGKAFLEPPAATRREQLERVLFLGRLAPEKNIEAVTDAAERLPDIAFRIAGDGPLREQVEREAARLPNLAYLGWLTRDEVVAALDDVDMLVLPSSVEAFGTVAVEAMARRRLVLTSAQCGVVRWPELARGLVVPREDETIADAVERVQALTAADREQTVAAAHAAAHRINEQTLDGWLSVLVELANRAARFRKRPT